MAILRAGPWGNLNDSHKDEPAIIDENTDIYPVNCALGDWPNQTWACVAETVAWNWEGPNYIFSKVGLGEEVSRSTVPALQRYTPVVTFKFCYQATDEFNINLNWSFTGSFNEEPNSNLSWSYSTIDGDQDSYLNTQADSGTEIIVLPKATLGIVTAYVQGYGTDVDPLTLTASLSKPA